MSNSTLIVTVRQSANRALAVFNEASRNYRMLKTKDTEFALDLERYIKILGKVASLWREEELLLEEIVNTD